MKTALVSVALAGVVLALTASSGGVLARGYSAAQEGVTIGVDADPTDNTATSLGSIDSCRSVSSDETFQVDIFVADVTDLLAWETYLVYDISVINIVSRDVMMFQAANAGSNVFDVSEGLPDIDGWYGVAAVDIAEPPAPDSGSGVLARLTLKAVGPGISVLSLSPVDVNGDGTMDLAPWLKDFQGQPIGDLDGDEFFDGPISNGEIAVDTACPGATPAASPTSEPTLVPTETPTATAAASPTVPVSLTATPAAASPTPAAPSEGEETPSDGGPPWIIAYVGGAAAAVLLGGAALFAIRRRRVR